MKGRRIPIPADFAEYAVGKGRAELAAHYGAGVTTISKWRYACGLADKRAVLHVPDDWRETSPGVAAAVLCRRYGVGEWIIRKWQALTVVGGCPHGGSKSKPVPADFATFAHLPNEDLARHYGTSRPTVSRWRAVTGIRGGTGIRQQRPMPDDFPAKAAVMTNKVAAAHYRAATDTVRRWRRECGVRYSRPAPPPVVRQAPPHRPKALPGAGLRLMALQSGIPPRDTSLHGSAADFLRCHARTPVYRCSERGAADPQGGCWRYGNVVLAPDELLARAGRHGWRWSEAA